VVIVGAGLAGVCVLDRLLNADDPPSEITVVNPDQTLGGGLPFATTLPDAILNRTVARMEIARDPDRSFQSWMREHSDGEHSNDVGRTGLADSFAPRAEFGRYLRAHFDALVRDAGRDGVTAELVRGTCVAMRPHDAGGGVAVTVTGHGAIDCDEVVLAVGDVVPADPYRVADHPSHIVYPTACLSAIAEVTPNDTVAVLGTRMSAVEVALHLVERRGHPRVHLVSRTGLLPSVRAQHTKPWCAQVLTRENLDAYRGATVSLERATAAARCDRSTSTGRTRWCTHSTGCVATSMPRRTGRCRGRTCWRARTSASRCCGPSSI